ncbi:helix-turn-helix domain-containing protein [soil metagenome]
MKIAPKISLREYRALAEVRHQIRRFLNFSEDAAREHGVEARQHQLLLALAGLPEGALPTIGAAAERLQIEHHSAVELASRSAKAGLVAREASQSDRRQVRLRITAKGKRILERLSVSHRDELRSAAPTLLRALEAIVA